MVSVRKTLENLHSKFPDFTIDELFAILDCIREDSTYPTTITYPNGITYRDSSNKNISLDKNLMQFTTTSCSTGK